MGRTFFWFGFLYANKENERPPRQWLSQLNFDVSRNYTVSVLAPNYPQHQSQPLMAHPTERH